MPVHHDLGEFVALVYSIVACAFYVYAWFILAMVIHNLIFLVYCCCSRCWKWKNMKSWRHPHSQRLFRWIWTISNRMAARIINAAAEYKDERQIMSNRVASNSTIRHKAPLILSHYSIVMSIELWQSTILTAKSNTTIGRFGATSRKTYRDCLCGVEATDLLSFW